MMGITKRAKILFSALAAILFICMIALIAALGKLFLFLIPFLSKIFTAHSSTDSISTESSAIQRLTGIHESLERARDKMGQLVGNNTESEREAGELHERSKRNAIQ